MGASCCKTKTKAVFVETEVKFFNWKDAVEKNNMIALKIMHSNDPDLINEPIDALGNRALHFAIETKNFVLLEYVLENGANVNIAAGLEQNTALHQAVLMQDLNAVRLLFSFAVNEEIVNIDGRTPQQLCQKSFVREFVKAKRFRKKHLKNREKRKNRTMSSGDIIVAGMVLGRTSHAKIKQYEKDTSLSQNYFLRKEFEIEARGGMTVTEFGDEVGIDVDEIGMLLEKMESKARAWEKVAHKTPVLSKQTQIYKVLYSLALLTIRKKNARSIKMKQKPIRDLTIRMCKKLPKKKGKTMLTKELFEQSFHTLLYEIHDDLVEEDYNN